MTAGEPVRPAAVGTFTLAGLGARYTIGREHVQEPALRLADVSRPLSLDIETYGLGRDSWWIKAVTVGDAQHAVILDPRDPMQADLIRKVTTSAAALAIHNATYDVPSLIRNDLMRVEDIAKVWDTITWARLASPGEFGGFSLLDCAVRYLGARKVDVLSRAFTAAGLKKDQGYAVFDLDRPIYVQGAALDVITTARLFPVVRHAAWERITRGHPFAAWGLQGEEATTLLNREQRINRMFLRRQVKGLRVDLEFLDRYREQVGVERSVAQAVLDENGMEATNSGRLTEWLDGQGLIPAGYPVTKTTGRPSGEAKHLERIDHPLVEAYLMVKKADKIENDYLQKCVDLADANDRIHAPTAILGASATGRMSMSEPPIHQFPAPARGIILADEGDPFSSIDWSQIEPVVAANIARDHRVLEGYEAGTSDLYTDIGTFAGIERKAAKVVLLAQMYGEGMDKLAADLRITKSEAIALKDKVFGAMPLVASYIGQLKSIGRRHELIFTLSGRIVPIPSSNYNGEICVAAHKAVNYTIQGSAYDVLAEACIAIEDAGLGDAVYLAMHDELVVSTSAAEDIRRIMQTPPQRLCAMAGRTPVLRTDMAHMGDRWAAV